jgi:hypothetical protein
VKTNPHPADIGKGWFTYFRFYGPTEANAEHKIIPFFARRTISSFRWHEHCLDHDRPATRDRHRNDRVRLRR